MVRKKRDYNKKKFNNPFFPAKKKAHGFVKRLIPIFLPIGLLLIFYFSYRSLTISDIKINGGSASDEATVRNIIATEMTGRRFFIFHEDSIIFFNSSKAAVEAKKIPTVFSIAIEKRLPHTLIININNKSVSAVLLANGSKYYLDETGKAIKIEDLSDVVVENSNSNTQLIRLKSDSANYPAVVIDNLSKLNVGDVPIKKNNLDFILAVDKLIKKRGGFVPLNYNLNLQTAEVDLSVTEGWHVKFNSLGNAGEQVDSLYLILNNSVSSTSVLHYVDVRYGDKVFYQ